MARAPLLFDAELQLINTELWDTFDRVGTEMIITKNGRCMFPHINCHIGNLDPTADYCVYVDFPLAQRCRYKFSTKDGWIPAGQDETQNSRQVLIHPESPSKGLHWMSHEEVSFRKLKLTNSPAIQSRPSTPDLVVLSSMHKYQPRIVLVKTSNISELFVAPAKAFVFPQLKFIAVTAYQNREMTQLKIKHNAFAKGFRETGKSYLKRKTVAEDGRESPAKKIATCSMGTPSPQSESDLEPAQEACKDVAAPRVDNGSYYSSYPYYYNYQYYPAALPGYYQYSLHPSYGNQYFYEGMRRLAYQQPLDWQREQQLREHMYRHLEAEKERMQELRPKREESEAPQPLTERERLQIQEESERQQQKAQPRAERERLQMQEEPERQQEQAQPTVQSGRTDFSIRAIMGL